MVYGVIYSLLALIEKLAFYNKQLYGFIISIKEIIVCCNVMDKWDKVFKNGPSKICGRQPLNNLKRHTLLKQTISLQIF